MEVNETQVEEDEVLEEMDSDSVYKIDIVKIKKVKPSNINRMEREKKEFLIKYINKENSEINLKYLFYDYFERDEDNINSIKEILIKEIKNNWNEKFNKFYETVKIFNKIKS